MPLQTYLTVQEANAILGEDLPWENAETSDKQDALEMSRIYIEANYKINFDVDGDAPEKVKIASAIIANAHLTRDIFERQTNLGSLEVSTVKAEGVEVTKKYTNKISKTWVDPFPKATAILKPHCFLKVGSGISYRSIKRA